MRTVLVAAVFTLGLTVPAVADDIDDLVDGIMIDDQACDIVKRSAADLKPKLPIRDKSGRITYGVIADCAESTMTFQRRYDFPVSRLKAGWYEATSAQWSKGNCANSTIRSLVDDDWHIVQTLTFKGGKTYSMEVKC